MVKENEPAIITRVVDASKQAKDTLKEWWILATSTKRQEPDPKNLVRIKELPIYPEEAKEREYKFVEDDPLIFQREVSAIRKTFGHEFRLLAEKFKGLDKTVEKSKDVLLKTKLYVDEEWTVLPKAAAITVGGMAGFVLGLKRGAIGRSIWTGIGLATMTAFCYPYETVDMIRTGIAHSESAWHRFKESPEPPRKTKT